MLPISSLMKLYLRIVTVMKAVPLMLLLIVEDHIGMSLNLIRLALVQIILLKSLLK